MFDDDSGGCFAVVAFALALFVGFSVGCMVGFNKMQQDAVDASRAQWVATDKGKVEFVWKGEETDE